MNNLIQKYKAQIEENKRDIVMLKLDSSFSILKSIAAIEGQNKALLQAIIDLEALQPAEGKAIYFEGYSLIMKNNQIKTKTMQSKGEQLATAIMPFITMGIENSKEAHEEVYASIAKMINNTIGYPDSGKEYRIRVYIRPDIKVREAGKKYLPMFKDLDNWIFALPVSSTYLMTIQQVKEHLAEMQLLDKKNNWNTEYCLAEINEK